MQCRNCSRQMQSRLQDRRRQRNCRLQDHRRQRNCRLQDHRRQRNCRLQESARGCDNRRQPEESDGRPACGECCVAVWLMPFRIPEPGYCWERRENPPVPCLGDSFRKNLQIFRLDQSKHDHRKTGTVYKSRRTLALAVGKESPAARQPRSFS